MLSAWKGCCAPIQQRWVLSIMGLYCVMFTFAMKNSLSLTMNDMVVSNSSPESEEVDETLCRAENTTSRTNTSGGTFEWSESTKEMTLSSFYWGYVITQIPGGMLADKFGGKYILVFGMSSTAIVTLITPFIVEWGSSTAMIVLRVLLGLGEGLIFPALSNLLAHWIPKLQRSFMGTLVFSGPQLGTMFANAMSDILLNNSPMGWQSVFYFFSGISILWLLIFVFICYSSPQIHPFVSDKEKELINNATKDHTHKTIPFTPWRHILRSFPIWALVAAQIGHDLGIFIMIRAFPFYVKNYFHFSMDSNDILRALPYLAMFNVGIFSSIPADRIINSGKMSITNVRKLFATTGSIIPAIFVIAAAYANCNQVVVICLYIVGMGFMGTYYSGIRVNALDLSPNYAGTTMGIVNGIGAVSILVMTYLIEVLTPNSTPAEWRMVFWIVGAILIVTNIVFLVFASGEVQYWNDPEFLCRDKREEENRKVEEADGASKA